MKPHDPALKCAYVNHKPGTAKTTCATYTASALYTLGADPLQVDADPGMSALRWSDLANGFPWGLVGLPKRTIRTDIVTVTERGDWDSVVLDLPQMEDHEHIVRPALEYADIWIMPIAPAPIEVDRAVQVVAGMDKADLARRKPGVRLALLNRTNRITRSQDGPDARCAKALTDLGFTVLDAQVNHSDQRYRQCFGTVPDPMGTPFITIAETLLELSA